MATAIDKTEAELNHTTEISTEGKQYLTFTHIANVSFQDRLDHRGATGLGRGFGNDQTRDAGGSPAEQAIQ